MYLTEGTISQFIVSVESNILKIVSEYNNSSNIMSSAKTLGFKLFI